MKRSLRYQISCIAFVLISLVACGPEDIGPYQAGEQTYALSGFDRLDMGSAFSITVQSGVTFSIVAEGDQRNLDDLDVYTRSGTLFARYRNSRNRKHRTAFLITMPTLRGVAFSGASQSTITGFTNLRELDIELSGASKGEFTVQAARTNIGLSGASNLQLNGNGSSLAADLSGASKLQAFTYPVAEANINVSGASKASVSVNTALVVDASGASTVRYRGTPTVRQHVSGASSVQND
ncbi:DUF2807 domain-containing protein [Spirosoma taeanense]|uniref:DUF2807 domain-containing protein n=1 Tax=Spirosoma taeanense TaxID=2735870 RepID=A0A6M5Y1C7_9BACT|nr:head GIN domain-containing protein [Spirosoma taeanense]QJW88527.1 DUF2807 domain-containing protein [Spirosoma taeanense]